MLRESTFILSNYHQILTPWLGVGGGEKWELFIGTEVVILQDERDLETYCTACEYA